jgi:hypothetical protein
MDTRIKMDLLLAWLGFVTSSALILTIVVSTVR